MRGLGTARGRRHGSPPGLLEAGGAGPRGLHPGRVRPVLAGVVAAVLLAALIAGVVGALVWSVVQLLLRLATE